MRLVEFGELREVDELRSLLVKTLGRNEGRRTASVELAVVSRLIQGDPSVTDEVVCGVVQTNLATLRRESRR